MAVWATGEEEGRERNVGYGGCEGGEGCERAVLYALIDGEEVWSLFGETRPVKKHGWIEELEIIGLQLAEPRSQEILDLIGSIVWTARAPSPQ